MTTKTTFFLLGVCAGVAVSLMAKAVRPYGAYAVAGGMLAYEAVCDAIETSADAFSGSIKKLQRGLRSQLKGNNEKEK